jgi:hypothetical protein
MLTVRSAQMEILARGVGAGTEERALRHLRQCLPEVCQRSSDADLLDIIRWGRRRSQRHGIESELDFFRYLNLMFMFGFEFDTDPRYPWAEDTLRVSRPSRRKMDLLMDHALLYCSRLESAHTA